MLNARRKLHSSLIVLGLLTVLINPAVAGEDGGLLKGLLKRPCAEVVTGDSAKALTGGTSALTVPKNLRESGFNRESGSHTSESTLMADEETGVWRISELTESAQRQIVIARLLEALGFETAQPRVHQLNGGVVLLEKALDRAGGQFIPILKIPDKVGRLTEQDEGLLFRRLRLAGIFLGVPYPLASPALIYGRRFILSSWAPSMDGTPLLPGTEGLKTLVQGVPIDYLKVLHPWRHMNEGDVESFKQLLRGLDDQFLNAVFKSAGLDSTDPMFYLLGRNRDLILERLELSFLSPPPESVVMVALDLPEGSARGSYWIPRYDWDDYGGILRHFALGNAGIDDVLKVFAIALDRKIIASGSRISFTSGDLKSLKEADLIGVLNRASEIFSKPLTPEVIRNEASMIGLIVFMAVSAQRISRPELGKWLSDQWLRGGQSTDFIVSCFHPSNVMLAKEGWPFNRFIEILDGLKRTITDEQDKMGAYAIRAFLVSLTVMIGEGMKEPSGQIKAIDIDNRIEEALKLLVRLKKTNASDSLDLDGLRQRFEAMRAGLEAMRVAPAGERPPAIANSGDMITKIIRHLKEGASL